MGYTAFLFPGQGAQYVGMGKEFAEVFAVARETFEEADELLSLSLSKIIFEGPEALLTETRHSQLAIFTVGAALLRVLEQQLPEICPSVCAGLSLGEYTALYASKRISFADALRLVRLRGELMNRACENSSGTMAAVLGLSASQVEAVVKPMERSHRVWVANFNCPGQTVISGTKEGVLAASEALKASGAKRVLPLQVHGAFHSGLMQPAQDGLEKAILQAPLVDSSIEIAMNVPGDYVKGLDQIRKYLILQVTSSVKWEQSIGAINGKAPELYLEIGCGKTLTGMNRKIGVKAPSLSLETPKDLEEIARLKELAWTGC